MTMALRKSSASLLMTLLTATMTFGDDNPGTTIHLKDIFLGRCYDYRQTQFTDVLPMPKDNCLKLWDNFFHAFSYQPPCAVDMKQYAPFMTSARQDMPKDKTVFWSGVDKELVSDYTRFGKRLVSLEDTMMGYVVDGLVWCGQATDPGMNYTRCPSWADCPSEASQAFWAAASTTFAAGARGRVTVLTDGARADRPAYSRDSFFGQYELPGLNVSAVTAVDVIVTHPLDQPANDSCGLGSINLLQADVTKLGLNFTCTDNPQAILHILCAEDPVIRECTLVSRRLQPDAAHAPDSAHRGASGRRQLRSIRGRSLSNIISTRRLRSNRRSISSDASRIGHSWPPKSAFNSKPDRMAPFLGKA